MSYSRGFNRISFGPRTKIVSIEIADYLLINFIITILPSEVGNFNFKCIEETTAPNRLSDDLLNSK